MADDRPDRVGEPVVPYPHVKLTYREYALAPDGQRYELVEGVLMVTPSPAVRHQAISAAIEARLRVLARSVKPGFVIQAPLDVILDPHNVFQPDVLYIRKDRRHIITDPNIQGAPDVVVEIISLSTEKRDREMKAAVYARCGVQELWFVDPYAAAFEVFVNDGGTWQQTTSATEGDVYTPYFECSIMTVSETLRGLM